MLSAWERLVLLQPLVTGSHSPDTPVALLAEFKAKWILTPQLWPLGSSCTTGKRNQPLSTRSVWRGQAQGSTGNAIAAAACARGSSHKPAVKLAQRPGPGCCCGGKHHSHGFSSFCTSSARTAPCWLLHPGLAWRRTGGGTSKLWLVEVVAGRQRHSAQRRLLQPGPSVK